MFNALDTAQDYIDENLIPTLVQVLIHFCDWCNKYITNDDRIPDDRISDIFAIASTAHHDYWHEPIANILSYIPALLFDVIINTAFDYDYDYEVDRHTASTQAFSVVRADDLSSSETLEQV